MLMKKETPNKSSPRPGRPPKPQSLRKTCRLQLLLTPSEHEAIRGYAERRDTSVAQVIRAYIRSITVEAEGGDRC